MELRVLGPLELVGEDGLVPMPAAKQRRVLISLAIADGRPVSFDRLIDALWDGPPPKSADNLLRVYVSQLRKLLPSPARIVTREGAYQLELPVGAFDSKRFESLLADGRRAAEAGNLILASSRLRRATSLWYGRAFDDAADDHFVRLEAARLEEVRLVTLEELFECELGLGRAAAILGELLAVAAAQPLRERLQAQLMLCLYRCERQTDALEVYASVRRRLQDELGLEPGSELRELQRRILQHDPSLAAPPAPVEARGELPVPPNPLLGRDRELRALGELILARRSRLVVLTGAGGSGKTRLALEVARAAAQDFANGVVVVDLAPLDNPELVSAAIAQALDLEPSSGAPLEVLARALAPREVMLLLDNAEQVRDGMGVLVPLLECAPRLSVLVTSRVVLHLSGEQVFSVAPLPVESARELFCARARGSDPAFSPSHDDDEAIAKICTRVDGLPLAVELAAARMRTLDPSELLERLEPALPLLSSGPRDLTDRQRTMTATIAWSFGLLDHEQRRDLAALAVFAGGWTHAAAAQVCEIGLEDLTELVDHNLVRRSSTAHGSRFTMLATIREYALARLDELRHAAAIHRRHAQYFLDLARSANLNPGLLQEGGQQLEMVIADRDNIRAALQWSVESRSIELGLELAVSADQLWVTADPREAMRWLGTLLVDRSAESSRPELRAHALRAYGSLAHLAGDRKRAAEAWGESLGLFESLHNAHGRAVILHRLGILALEDRDWERARTLVGTSEGLHERNDDQWQRRWGLAQTVATEGVIARETGDELRALELLEESVVLAREAGVAWWETCVLDELAALSLKLGRTDDAERHALEATRIAVLHDDRPAQVLALGILAAVAAKRGDAETSAALWCAVADEHARSPLGGWERHQTLCASAIRQAHIELSPEQRVSLHDAVALALARSGAIVR